MVSTSRNNAGMVSIIIMLYESIVQQTYKETKRNSQSCTWHFELKGVDWFNHNHYNIQRVQERIWHHNIESEQKD